jgi:hypothetical protein
MTTLKNTGFYVKTTLKLEVILANIAYFIIVSDCFFWLLGSLSGVSSGGVRAGEFLTRCTQRSGAVSRGQVLILNTPNGGTYGFTYLIR